MGSEEVVGGAKEPDSDSILATLTSTGVSSVVKRGKKYMHVITTSWPQNLTTERNNFTWYSATQHEWTVKI